MARMGSGESGAPGKPVKVTKPAAQKVVRKVGAPPKTDVQSSGGDYGTKKAKAYQRTPAAQKPVIVASKQLVRDINTGKTRSVVVKQPHLAHPGHDLLSGINLKSLAAYFTGNQYTGQKPGLADTIHRAEDQTAKGAVYLGDTGKNIIRRLQGPGSSTNEASVFPAADVAKRAAQNLPVDFANTMVNAIPAATHIGSEIAHGHVERVAKQLVQPYVDIAEHPGRNLVQHPFSTTMLLTGPVRGFSRGVGAAARRGAFGDAAKSAASTSRESATVPGTKLVHPREYSPDPVGKAVQVSKEKGKVPFSKERKAVKLNKQADQAAAAGNHEHAATLRHQAALASPTRMPEQQVKHRVDVIRDTNEVVRSRHAGQVSEQVHAAVRNRETVGGKVKKVKSTGVRPTAAVSLVAQKITYPTVEDLRTYQSELAHEHATGDLTPSQRAANEQLRSQIQDALDHPQDMGLVQQAADKYLAVERGITQKLVGHRMIEPGEAAKRREMPFSSRFAGGSRDAKVRLTQAGTDSMVMKERRAEQGQRVVRAEKAVASTRQALDKTQLDLAQRSRAAATGETVPATGADRVYGQEHSTQYTYINKSVHDPKWRAETRSLSLPPGREAGLHGTHRLSQKAIDNIDTTLRNDGFRRVDLPNGGFRWERPSRVVKRSNTTISEQRPLPRTTVLGRKAKATGGQGVRDMLRWIDQVEQRDPTVVRSKIVKPVGQSPADRLRTAIATHENAKTVVAKEKTAGRTLRAEAKQLRKDTKGKKLKQAPGWVDAQGRPLTAEQMRAEREHGVTDAVTGKTIRAPLPGEAAYVSHMPNLLKPGSFYRDSGNATGLGTKHFTGGSVTKGTLDASEEALHANARRLQSLLDAHEGHLAYLDETAMRDKAGAIVKGDRARVDQAIERATVDSRGHILPGARKWRVVRVNPVFGGRPGQLEELMNNLNAHGELHSNDLQGGVNPVISSLEDALRGRGDGPFVAVPEEAVVRLEQHLRQLGNQTGQVWNVLTSLWRKNVLAFSPKWMASNLGEATERSLVEGVRPGDRALLVKTVDAWMKEDPAAAERFLASIGQGHFGMIGRNQRYATAREFTDATRNGPFVRFAARLAGTIQRTPVANWLPKAYGEYTRTVMSQMGSVEGQFRMAMAGSKLRDLTQNSRAFADLSEKGVRQALEGLKETPTQIQIGWSTRKAFGQYEAFSPVYQAWIRNYTPFVPWAVNAVRFLAVTLPRDHPVITAIAADLTRSQEPWLRKMGLWLGTLDALPSYELGDVPVAGGGLLKVAKYTPPSLVSDLPGTLAGLILPQGQNITMALRGLDAFGNPLRESKQSAILKALLGIVVPSPIAPRSTGGSGVLDVLNPAQVIPKSKVDYSRVKATLDRINNQITLMPQAEKTKRKDGTWPPKYAALLKQRSELLNTRNVLLVKAGFKKDPAINVEQKIRKLRVQAGRLKNQTDQYGAHTKAYTDLRTQIRALEAQRKKLLGTTKPRVRRIMNRPLTTHQQIQREITNLHKRDIHKEIQDEINRMHEQEKVNQGG